MPLSLKERLYQYLLKNHQWFNGGELERLALGAGYKASNCSRRLRELHEEGKLERQIRKGNKVASVWYRYKIETPYTQQLAPIKFL